MLPLLSPYEKNQRRSTLTYVICLTLVASLLLTLFNIQFGSILSLISLSILDILCIIALVLNLRGHYYAAAIFISVMILIAITFNIYDGDGLFDPGVAAYPLFITVGTLILGKRAVLGFTLSSVISLLFIGFLQSKGLIDVTVAETEEVRTDPGRAVREEIARARILGWLRAVLWASAAVVTAGWVYVIFLSPAATGAFTGWAGFF